MAVIRKGERFHELPGSGEEGLDRLRAYLSDWADWTRKYRVQTGLPNSVPYLDSMRASYSDSFGQPLDDYQTVNTVAMRIIDAAMTDLSQAMSHGPAALNWRYLNANGPAVYRSGRLPGLSMMELDALADAAELALLPIVKRKGLLL